MLNSSFTEIQHGQTRKHKLASVSMPIVRELWAVGMHCILHHHIQTEVNRSSISERYVVAQYWDLWVELKGDIPRLRNESSLMEASPKMDGEGFTVIAYGRCWI